MSRSSRRPSHRSRPGPREAGQRAGRPSTVWQWSRGRAGHRWWLGRVRWSREVAPLVMAKHGGPVSGATARARGWSLPASSNTTVAADTPFLAHDVAAGRLVRGGKRRFRRGERHRQRCPASYTVVPRTTVDTRRERRRRTRPALLESRLPVTQRWTVGRQPSANRYGDSSARRWC